MIDLHMHSTYSDGTESCSTILKKCQNKNLDFISITDHNTALGYEELEDKNISSLFNGHIIPGIELNTKVLNIPIEILGYGIDYKKINELVKKYIFLLRKEITKHKENKKLLSEYAWNSSKIFYRQYMSDPKTKLYVEMDDLVPDFETACNLIRKARGLVFIPHIYEYKKNSETILKHILQNYKIDGIECYYTTFTEAQHKKLLNICKEHNLFISGGSDFHGTIRPDVDIGIGHGNMQIPNEILDSWKNKIRYLQ